MKGLTCKTYDRYRPPLAGNLSPCIFSYKPHSLPSANNLPSGLTGQRSSVSFLYRAQRFPVINIFRSGISRPAISRRPIFLYRANLSLSLAITFHQGAFGVDLNLTASNLSLSFSIFCSLFFLLFLSHSLPTPSLSNIPNFYFFRIFFADFHKKQHPLLDAVRFLVQFFGVFIQKILCILKLK